jgi:hypothetical protein
MNLTRYPGTVAGTLLCVGTLALALAGCANSGGTQTAVAGTEVALTAAEKAATLYVTLPQCGPAHPAPICSDAPVIAKIKAADNVAFDAVMAARAGGSDAKVATANAAIAALVELIPAATTH